MPLISEAPQQLGKRGPELQLRNTMGWRPSIMLRTSDVNRGGVPPARVSTQDTTVPGTHARAALSGGQIGVYVLARWYRAVQAQECVTARRIDTGSQRTRDMVQGIPTSLLQQSQVQFTPAARPVRDDVAETATRGLLANLKPPYPSCCQCTPPHKFRPEILVLHCAALASLAPASSLPEASHSEPPVCPAIDRRPCRPRPRGTPPNTASPVNAALPCLALPCWPRPHLLYSPRDTMLPNRA